MGRISLEWCAQSIGQSPLLFQLVASFAGGLVLAPWSWGFIFFLVFILLYEIFACAFLRYPPFGYRPGGGDYIVARLGVISAALAGFILGRVLIGDNEPLRPEF